MWYVCIFNDYLIFMPLLKWRIIISVANFELLAFLLKIERILFFIHRLGLLEKKSNSYFHTRHAWRFLLNFSLFLAVLEHFWWENVNPGKNETKPPDHFGTTYITYGRSNGHTKVVEFLENYCKTSCFKFFSQIFKW